MFEGEKTSIFWIGLIIFALACIEVFSVVWFVAVIYSPFLHTLELQVKAATPFIVGGIVFLIVGLYMMKSGVKKKDK